MSVIRHRRDSSSCSDSENSGCEKNVAVGVGGTLVPIVSVHDLGIEIEISAEVAPVALFTLVARAAQTEAETVAAGNMGTWAGGEYS